MDLGTVFITAIAFNIGRYFICSGAMAYLARVVWPRTRPEKRFRQHRWTRRQHLEEIKSGLQSCLVFALFATIGHWMYLNGWTRIYLELSALDFAIVPLSLVLVALLHDFYFFTTHLWMHRNRWLYKHVHSVHHRFRHPSPFSDIAFHPGEAAIHSAYIIVVFAMIPAHPITLGLYLSLVTAVNIIGHTGFEFFTDRFAASRIGSRINRPTDHLTHHINPNVSFGLYFNYLDRLWQRYQRRSSLNLDRKNLELSVASQQIAPETEKSVDYLTAS